VSSLDRAVCQTLPRYLDIPCQKAEHRPPQTRAANGRREERIAIAILEAARSEATCLGGARIVRVGVRVGEDCDIHVPALRHAIQHACEGTELEAASIHVIQQARRYSCCICGFKDVSGLGRENCPECGSLEIELTGGDELELAFLEVKQG
jgi:hydrogenase nickel incorporation protein HypA/HybF